MRIQNSLTTVLLAICCIGGVHGRLNFQRRQDNSDITSTTNGPSSASSTNDASSTSPVSGSASPTSGSQTSASPIPTSASMSPSSSAQVSTTSQEPTSAITLSTPGTKATASPTSGSSSEVEALPIQPRITPALGLAGVILIAFGATLCIVGIKHKWLYIFLSTAFLTSLAVTVLIVYLMNPPVSDAIQGAYFVAAVSTGLIFGGLALVFKEVCEGLGCLLGGFCLAMWFLCLAPGGLIGSTTGRAILIGVFCVIFFGLYFSQYTRMYGLIGCTAFAGAQIAVLGVDCFSRAGLKEFWLYIWDLNNNEFPLGTTTYPITRGIKVELACVIIAFFLGIMSQVKIWKIVRERRSKREEERVREDERKEQMEAELGRNIEAGNNRDLREWEAVYGDKHGSKVNVDSAVGSSIESDHKGPRVSERELDEIELEPVQPHFPRRTSKRESGQGSIQGASDDRPPTASEENLLDKAEARSAASHRSMHSQASHMSRSSAEAGEPSDFEEVQPRASSEVSPAIMPLPFRIPQEGDEEQPAAADSESLVSRGTAAMSVLERPGMPLTQLSLKRQEQDDRYHTPRIEQDCASSVAATADEDADVDALSTYRLSRVLDSYHLDTKKDGLLVPSDDEASSRDVSRSPRHSMIEPAIEEEDEEAIIRPSTALNDVGMPASRSVLRQETGRMSRQSKDRSPERRRISEEPLSQDHDQASLVGSLTDHLPGKMSKVAMTYRTNEWAKHIADADEPVVPEEESHSPGVQVDSAFAEEAVRPVDTEALKPADLPAEKPARTGSKEKSKNPYRQSTQPPRRTSSGSTTPLYAFQRSNSAMSIERSGSAMSLSQQNSSGSLNPPPVARNPMRSPTPLIVEPLIESPAEEAAENAFNEQPARRVASAMSLASQFNLMGERSNRLKHKATSMSFNELMAYQNNDTSNLVQPSDSASVRAAQFVSEPEELDEENMTLAQRKAMVQQQQREAGVASPTSPRRRETFGAAPAPGQANLIYDSHQPRRTHTVDNAKKAHMLSAWRSSLAQDAIAKTAPTMQDGMGRQAMLSERRVAEMEQQRQAGIRAQRESVMDAAMRTGQFHGAHRDAMRRMQAKANKQAPL